MRVLIVAPGAAGRSREDEAEVLRRALESGGHDVRVRARIESGRDRRVPDEWRPEVVHLVGGFLARELVDVRGDREAGAAVVVSLNDLTRVCLAGTLVRGGRLCLDCVGRLPWRGIVHRCRDRSVVASAHLAGAVIRERMRGDLEDVDRFVAHDDLVQAVHVEAGVPAERVTVVHLGNTSALEGVYADALMERRRHDGGA